MEQKPVIAITMGDPAGIGPELCLKLLNNKKILSKCVPVIFGDISVLKRVSDVSRINLPNDVIKKQTVIDFNSIDINKLKAGKISKDCGKASYQYIEAAITSAKKGIVKAVVTNPINKKALNMAGIRFAGHTEIFASQTNTKSYCMMQTSDELTVSFVTTHTSIKSVSNLLSVNRIVEVIDLTNKAMKKLKNKRNPNIGICGLNPHCGENGLFGNEEIKIINPAIKIARKKGIKVSGPIVPDVAFMEKIRSKYDAIVCMYHDQGHIPFKMLAFDKGVNVTLGLPIIRTSVDHGTAFDIAWRGKANPNSLFKAIDVAIKLFRD